jgi:ABC-type bacteriocin/lantibiotic exporter with double-glycine peptidase domain
MIKLIFNTYLLIPKNFSLKFLILIFLIILSATLEMLSIALILPLIKIFFEPNSLENYHLIENILKNITPLNFFESSFTNQQLLISSCILIFFIFIFIKFIYFLFFYKYQANFLNKIHIDLSLNRLKKIINTDYLNFIKKDQTNYTNTLMTDIPHLISSISFLLTIFAEFTILIFITSLIFYINFQISLFSFLILFFGILIYILVFKNKLNIMSNIRQKLELQRLEFLTQIFNLFKEIHLMKKKEFFILQYEKILLGLSKSNIFFQFIGQIPKFWFELLSSGLLIFLIYFMLLKNYTNSEILTILGLYLVSLIKLLPSINKLTAAIQGLKYFENIITDFQNDSHGINLFEKKEKKFQIVKNFNNIKYKNIQFAYHANNNVFLSNISFELKNKGLLGIAGKSGSGKTTLINIISGLIKPTNGEIFIDDKLISGQIDWRNNIGCVPQDIFIINDTIEKNVAFGIDKNKIDNKKVIQCLQEVQLYDQICDLQKKEQTSIINFGKNFSGGQRQRLGIARCFYNDYKLVIFDESTNALDIESESEILNLIKKLSLTRSVVLISHKEKVLQACDKILNLDTYI